MKNEIPAEGFLRLAQIIGDRKAEPPIPPIVPVSRTTWLEGVKTGRFPKPVKIGGGRIVMWRASDIRKFVEGAA
jgi:prophage regulatory protein